ncbi:hypothetical protein ACLI4U_00205 [Natrialbaceae archaeon A-CW2]|uniref:hypothetical protein n=1 Tax=Natronosalvus amylolyticus TaxID=2961994 RepID=UPI0020C961B1|nr:hypothetical protein [Natronosalvus amylolyticus]
MKRRALFGTLGLIVTSGCLSILAESAPVTFEIVNFRAERFTADVTLRHDSAVVLDGFVDIPAREPDEDAAGLSLQVLENVSNGDAVDARIEIDGREYEDRYEITCSESDRATNTFQFTIWSSEDRGGMEFGGSTC